MKFAIINGPNLNLLGKREPTLYGNTNFDDYYASLKKNYAQVLLSYFQSNIEGELVTKIQEFGFEYNGIILNAGAYTHTSIAIHDAIAAVPAPVVEVHISNIYAREEFRHTSLITSKCAGLITGFGLVGYEMALQFLINQKK